MTWILVALGGGIGATLRYSVDAALRNRFPGLGTWSTAVINVTGSFLLGLSVAILAAGPALSLLGTGVLGAFTTFSTAAFELLRSAEDGRWGRTTSLALGVLVAAVLAASAGLALGRLA